MLRNIQTDTTRPKKHREQLHATSRFKPPDHPFLVGAATNLQEFCIAPYQLQRWARKFDGWLKLFSCYMNSYWYFARKTCYFLFKGLKQAMLLYLRVSSQQKDSGHSERELNSAKVSISIRFQTLHHLFQIAHHLLTKKTTHLDIVNHIRSRHSYFSTQGLGMFMVMTSTGLWFQPI